MNLGAASFDVIVLDGYVFDVETQPLLDFYAKRGLLLDINGEQPVQDVFADITAAIDRFGSQGN